MDVMRAHALAVVKRARACTPAGYARLLLMLPARQRDPAQLGNSSFYVKWNRFETPGLATDGV